MSAPSKSSPVRGPRRRPLRTALLFVGALLFLFEEWLWTCATRFFEWLTRLGLTRWLDAKLVRLPPALALVVLCIPMLLLFPFKVAGLWMIAHGRFVTGCLIMLAAKVASTAVIARLFVTCRPQLMRIAWFARLYAWIGALRERVHQWMLQQPAWFEAKRFVRRMHGLVGLWLQQRFGGDLHGGRRGALRRWRQQRRARRSAAMASAGLRGDGEPR